MSDNVTQLIAGSTMPEDALHAYADWNSTELDEDTIRDAEDAYLGSAHTLRDWAEQWADDIGLLHGIPEDLRYYFDHERWARDGCLGGDIYVTEGHGRLHVFHS